MNKVFGAAAAALMATAAWAADPTSDTSSTDTSTQDTSTLKDTTPAKGTYELGSTATAQTGSTGKVTAKDQAAIKDVATNLAKAFNSSDAKAAADLFAQDGVLIDPMGNKAVGKAEIEHRIGSNMKEGFLKGSSTVYTNIEAKMVKPDVAFVDMDHQITKTQVPTEETATDQAAKPAPRIHVSALLVKQGGKWLIEEARPGTYVEQPPAPAS